MTGRLRNRVLELWRQNRPVVTSWLCVGNPVVAEAMANRGFDACLVDMQHGMIDEGTAINMLAAISTVPDVTPIARVRCNHPDKIHFLLDAGALGIVCPLINNAKEVIDFVAACRYPPQGSRSFGPGRGHFASKNYLAEANDNIATLAMIETHEAVQNLDEIVAVDGLDGVFIGPNDLALALGIPPTSEPSDPRILDVINRIRTAAHKGGKKAGIFCGDGNTAKRFVQEGFDFVCPGWDVGYLIRAADEELEKVRGAKPEEEKSKGGY